MSTAEPSPPPLLYWDPCFLEHRTGSHPECPARVARIMQHLEESGLAAACQARPVPIVSAEDRERVHLPAYAEHLRRVCDEGGGPVEADTVVSPQSFDVANRAAGAAVDAVRQVLAGNSRKALCVVRPPGHHCLPEAPMGFCLFNSIAIAARTAVQTLGLSRVLIVDWDCHHGNGTQDIFWNDEQVAFFSQHRYPFYPGTGSASESGSGPGLGWTHNVPTAFGTKAATIQQHFRRELEAFAERAQPELVLISAGFDSHHLDPIAGLGLDDGDFADLTNTVLDVADACCGGRVVSILEGGYHLDALPRSVAAHLERLLARA